MKKPYLALLIGLFLLAAGQVAVAAQQERILSYQSDITVRRDASLRVTETIKVYAAGQKIKRGIYRDFPEIYRSRGWLRLRKVVPLEIVSVERDGKPEKYHTERLTNGRRVYFGDKDVFLEPGEYTYRFTYTVGRQIGFHDGYDELYWNATGHDWDFTIQKAEAVVHLPGVPPSEIGELNAYTGPQGERGDDYTASRDDSGSVTFASTRALRSGEGLTISVTWPKGYVSEPRQQQQFFWFLRDNLGLLVAATGVAIVTGYYLLAWMLVGNDPDKGTIIPLYEPPEDLSPASLRFIDRMGYDRQTFAAAVINMAVKGYLSIKDNDGEYTLIQERSDRSDLSAEEKKIAGALFATGSRLTLVQKNHRKIKKAIKGAQRALRAGFEKLYFLKNSNYLVPGVILSLVFAVGTVVAYASAPAVFMIVWLSIWTVGVLALLGVCWGAWRTVLSGGGKRFATLGQAVFMTLFSIPFVGGEVLGIGMLAHTTSVAVPAMVILLAGISYLFYNLLKAPTLEGRRLMDRIDGFRMYLSVAEEDRLNLMNPPERTPELFERYLPYALALGVEQEWGEKFADVLSDASQGSESYSPSWYHGTAWSAIGASGFAGSLSGSFSGAIASSATAPGSSSGAGGGGFSGGGGGGGGGGGW